MKIRRTIIASFAAMVVANVAAAYAQDIRVVVDGERVRFHGQPAIEMDDRVLVPLRGVFESLGARVNWNPENQTVTARRGEVQVTLRIGDQNAQVNDESVKLDVPAQIIDDSTVVPLRFVGEALGDRVHWDEQTQTVSIVSDGNSDQWIQDHHDQGDYDVHRGWRKGEQNGDEDVPRRRDNGDEEEAPMPDRPRIVDDNIPDREPPVVYDVDTVIPVSVDEDVDLSHCHLGQRITTVVPTYPGLPPDCQVSGVVTSVDGTYGYPRRFGIRFDTIVTPGGRHYHIDGHSVPFDSLSVSRGQDGLYHRRGYNSSVNVVRADNTHQRFGIRMDHSVTIHRESERSERPTRSDQGQDRGGNGGGGHRFSGGN